MVHAPSKTFLKGFDQSNLHVTRRENAVPFGLARTLSGYQTRKKEVTGFVTLRIVIQVRVKSKEPVEKIISRRLIKNAQVQGAQLLRSEAYLNVRCNKPAPCLTRGRMRGIPRSAGQMGVFQQPVECQPSGMISDTTSDKS